MNITSAQYIQFEETGENISIKVIIDGVTMHVPLDNNNRHYIEIMRQVEAGELTIADAE